MQILSHLWVLPVTGPNKDRGRTCYVCQHGSEPVIAAFIKPNSHLLETYITEVQKLYNDHSKLKAFVVILSGPDEGLKEELVELSERLKLAIPLTVLDPAIGLPDTLSIHPDAHVTMILYRGRHVEKIFEISPNQPAKIMAFAGDALPQLESISVDNSDKNKESFLMSSAIYETLDKAATEMIERQ